MNRAYYEYKRLKMLEREMLQVLNDAPSKQSIKKTETHREKTKQQQAIKEKREYWNNYKKEKGCKVCKYKKSGRALSFHHLENKTFSVSKLISMNKENSIIEEEIRSCIVLCANCHMELHDKTMT